MLPFHNMSFKDLSFVLHLIVESSCKSFVKLLSPIGGSDRHISCTSSSVPPSYSHAMVGDGLMLLGKIFWEIFCRILLHKIFWEIFRPMLLGKIFREMICLMLLGEIF